MTTMAMLSTPRLHSHQPLSMDRPLMYQQMVSSLQQTVRCRQWWSEWSMSSSLLPQA